MERLFATELAHRASRVMGKMAAIHLPGPILKQVISAYSIATGVSMDEVAEPPGGFKTFSEFFGRHLRDGARPICREPDALISPCDGRLIALGRTDPGDSPSFAVKGSRYTLRALLGREEPLDAYKAGGYLVIYLHPRDYHRVHAPARARLTRVCHVPGSRYPVNRHFDTRVAEIYGKNERLVFQFRLASGGVFSLIMVAAFGVGNMDSRFAPRHSKKLNQCREEVFEKPITMSPGDELGAFLIGSTVVMVWSENAFEMNDEITLGPVTFGSPLGRSKAGTRQTQDG